jgi:multisubunit Na+/H+ antiporter MnhG subunit
MDALIAVLLMVSVAIAILCCIGVLVAIDVFDKLHFTGPAAVLVPFLVAVAIAIEEGPSQATLKAFLVAALLGGLGPLVTHATARSARIRQYGGWEPREEEG